jgi:hypothetical protein
MLLMACAGGRASEPSSAASATHASTDRAPGVAANSGDASGREGSTLWPTNAASIPGYAGYFIDEEKIIISLVDLSYADAAAVALREVLPMGPADRYQRPSGELVPYVVLFRKVRYSLRDLASWKDDLLYFSLSARELVSIAIYQRDNVIRVGVPDRAAMRALEVGMERLRIPADAVDIQLRDYPQLD